MIKTKTEKDGNGFVTYTWEVDETKPQMWVDGHFYCFNTKLINIKYDKYITDKGVKL